MRSLRRGIAVLVFLWLAAELAAPLAAGHLVASEVARRDRSAATVSASVGRFPILARLAATGRVDRVSLELERVAGVRVSYARVRLDLQGVHVDRSALVRGRFRVTAIDEGRVEATLPLAQLGLAARAAARVVVSGHVLAVDGASTLVPDRLVPCTPAARLAGGEVVLSCTFYGVPWLLGPQ